MTKRVRTVIMIAGSDLTAIWSLLIEEERTGIKPQRVKNCGTLQISSTL